MSDNVFLQETEAPSAEGQLRMATLGSKISTSGWTLILDGQTSPTRKPYKHVGDPTLTSGDRVLVAKVSGTYVILGKVSS